MAVAVETSLKDAVAGARRLLDEHVREIVRWHFDPATGCPFWLDFARRLDFDPREAIGGYDDLKRLGHFDDDWLRGGPIRRFVPRAYADRAISVFETGGSTGLPKSRINVEDFRIDYEELSRRLPEGGFPRGADWLMLGPSGPRRLRLAIEHLAQHRGGICFLVDLDPRWVNQLIRDGRPRELEAYKRHVVDQGLKLLRAHESIRCVFTTPKLLEALSLQVSLPRLGLRGVLCGGTEMNPQFHRFAREELLPGVAFYPLYGNTLMGLACPGNRDRESTDRWSIDYYPPQPRAVLELVDPADPERTVGYGETGRVMLTTLTRELFMPRFLERDQAERAAPVAEFPWDGVRNVRLLDSLASSVVVGVY
jgi:phenylacetate-coenzyme A ligase PaaK-like adenylate-forming protein